MQSRESWIGEFVAYVAKAAPSASGPDITEAAGELYGRLGQFAPIDVAEADWDYLPLAPCSASGHAVARRHLERKLREVVSGLRALDSEGNLIVRVPETGDSVAILKINEEDAAALVLMLRGFRS